MKQKTLSKYEMIMKELNYKTIGGSLLGLFSVTKSFFCRHKWDDFKVRKFNEAKMDDKGRLTTKMVIRTCSKCEKIEHFAMD